MPWKNPGSNSKTARIICDINDSDNQPFTGSPRYALKKMLEEAAQMGYTMYVGPEPEFFMFHVDEDGSPTLKTNDKAGYFDLPPVDKGKTPAGTWLKPCRSSALRSKRPTMKWLPANMKLISSIRMLQNRR